MSMAPSRLLVWLRLGRRHRHNKRVTVTNMRLRPCSVWFCNTMYNTNVCVYTLLQPIQVRLF